MSPHKLSLAPVLALASALGGSLVVNATEAHASPPGATAVPTRPVVTGTRWYGWQILAADAALLATSAAIGPSSVGVFLATGPIIHVAHGNHGRAAVSLAVRVGAPIAGAALLSSNCPSENAGDDWECLGRLAVGVTLGAAAAEVVDLVLATDEVVEELPVTPSLQVAGGGATIGLGGTF